jgi:hypothetical protein
MLKDNKLGSESPITPTFKDKAVSSGGAGS